MSTQQNAPLPAPATPAKPLAPTGALQRTEAVKSAKAAPQPASHKSHNPNAKMDLSAGEASETIKQLAKLAREDETQAPREELAEMAIDANDAPVVQIVNALLIEAIKRRASDIHIEPYPDTLRVRFRVDGSLLIVHELPPTSHAGIVSRLKVMGSMNIAERRVPQDGRIKLATPLAGDGTIDFRVSTLPSIFGEKVVMRILGTGQLKDNIDQLGFESEVFHDVKDALGQTFGMILVTGPTGSGKTTTLYTMLRQLSQPDVNIVTAEDPVEYNLPGITQVSVKPAIDFTFDVALRSFLRQDPDIILVGEMRDYETAAIAIKASLTGHLVLSTVHTNDAPSTVVRLVDMGIEPYLVASAVKLVIAQRLIRRICTKCKEEVQISAAEQDNLHESTLNVIQKTYKGKGCDHCNSTGYRGRAPLFEVMPIKSKELKSVITEGGTEVMVAQVAKREGLRTLKMESLRLVNDGVTSLEEAMQIILSE